MEYIKYLKIKANFDSFAQPARNQQLLLDTIEETKVFLQEYPDSIYIPLVNTISFSDFAFKNSLTLFLVASYFESTIRLMS